jgi:hypothetical protein
VKNEIEKNPNAMHKLHKRKCEAARLSWPLLNGLLPSGAGRFAAVRARGKKAWMSDLMLLL